MTKNIIGVITVACIACMLFGFSKISKAEIKLDRERVYIQPTGEQIVVTDDLCDIPNLTPDTMPLRNAYGYDPKSNRKIEGCALEYTDVIEVQLWDDLTKIHLDLRIPIKNFQERSKI
jgi:hypothetical protein